MATARRWRTRRCTSFLRATPQRACDANREARALPRRGYVASIIASDPRGGIAAVRRDAANCEANACAELASESSVVRDFARVSRGTVPASNAPIYDATQVRMKTLQQLESVLVN